MKKSIKILALGAAMLGIGCVGLSGCGNGDEFASAETITVEEFNQFQTGVTNDIANYTVKYDIDGIVVDGHFVADSTGNMQFAMTLQIPEIVEGEGDITMQYYLKGDYVYVYSLTDNTKYMYNATDYLEMDEGYAEYADGEAFSIESFFEEFLSEQGLSDLTIKKLTTSDNQTKFQLKTEYTDSTTNSALSLTGVVVYDSNNQAVSMSFEENVKVDATNEFANVSVDYTITFEIAKSSEEIVFPDFKDYVQYNAGSSTVESSVAV